MLCVCVIIWLGLRLGLTPLASVSIKSVQFCFAGILISFAWKHLKTMKEKRLILGITPQLWEGSRGQRSQGSGIIKGICGLTGWYEAWQKIKTWSASDFLVFWWLGVWEKVCVKCFCGWSCNVLVLVLVLACVSALVCVIILTQHDGETGSRQKQSAVVLCLWLSNITNPVRILRFLETREARRRKTIVREGCKKEGHGLMWRNTSQKKSQQDLPLWQTWREARQHEELSNPQDRCCKYTGKQQPATTESCCWH